MSLNISLKEFFPFYKRNIRVAVPVMITQAGQYIVQLADNIMVGRLGTTELAGVAFANSIFIIGFLFSVGFCQGVTPWVGQLFGEGRHREAGRFFQQSILLNLILSILVMAALTVPYFLLDRMGQEAAVAEYGRQYLRIMILSLPFTILFFGIRQFSEGLGITRYAMWITLASNILNIFLNWLLIYGKWGCPRMGVEGAAAATLVSRIVALIAFTVCLFRIPAYRRYLTYFRRPWIDRAVIRKILSTSGFLSVQSVVEVFAFSMAAIMVGWFGDTQLAAHQVAMSISSFSFMIALGIGAAATIRVSHQFGAKDYYATKMAALASIHMSIAFMVSLSTVFLILRHHVPRIFSTDPAVIDLAAGLMVMGALYQIFDAIQLASLASLRGLADVRRPLLYSSIAYFLICIPCGYLFGFILDFGPRGVWAGLTFGLACCSLLFYKRFRHLIDGYLHAESR